MRRIFLCLFFPVSFSAVGQILQGTVYNQKDNKGLAFVNIGIVSKSTGTVSQADGSFSIELTPAFDDDTLQFSMLGFNLKKICVRDLKKQAEVGTPAIFMQEKSIILNDIVILPKKIKTDILGNNYDSPSITARFHSEKLGCELGTVMQVHNKRDYYLRTAGIKINACTYDSIIFRLNIYSYENGLPKNILNSTPVYATLHKGDTELNINLSPYNITVNGDFVVSLEWIQDVEGSHNNVGFPAGFLGARLYYKDTSLDDWHKAPANLGIGMYCIADYEK